MVNFKDFQKLDIRIGTVVKAEVPKWSHWVMQLTVDVGSLDLKESPSTRSTRSGRKPALITVFAGIMHHYKPDDLEGKQFPFIVNLEPKKIGPKGDVSEGMMLMAIDELDKPINVEGEEITENPIFLSPLKKVTNGTKVM